MIIDTHTHLGASYVGDSNYSEEQWLKTIAKHNLSGIMSYPNPSARPSPRAAHDRIHQFAVNNPGKVWGVVDLAPGMEDSEYVAEVERCVKQLGFVAIKLHPSMHPCNPMSAHCDKVFETAKKLDVPVIVHTGTGAPSSLPSMLLPRAKQFPTVRIVLAHAGAYVYTAEAIYVAMERDNIYLEPSWCAAHRIREMINKIGIERVMFGSDVPSNVGVELSKVEAAGLTDKEKELYLGLNAVNFYRLK